MLTQLCVPTGHIPSTHMRMGAKGKGIPPKLPTQASDCFLTCDELHGPDCVIHMHVNTEIMKSTKVQTLCAVALHTTTACTDDASTKSTQVGYSLYPALSRVCARSHVRLVPKLGLLLLQEQLY